MSDRSAAGFVAGFAPRHATTTDLLQRAFGPPLGFAPAGLATRVGRPHSFSPAAPGTNPTAGWDPFDANAPLATSHDTAAGDPIASAHAAGYAAGLAAAGAAGEAANDRDLGLAQSISNALSGRVDRDRVAEHLRRTVLFLVGRIVGETGVAPDILAGRIGAATDLLSDAAESAMLRVHPDDVALLDGRLPRTVFAVGDPHVARGGFVMETASTIVEDGPELWLDQLAAAIDRVAVPDFEDAAVSPPC